ncbi:MAG: glutathione S-transferase [Myxococcota bacterium]|jgi:glutathione S-transferase
MSRITLSYFDFPGGRGEDCRLALFLAGIPFDDDRVDPKDWPVRKSATPFGGLPVMSIEDVGELAESNAILGLIGRRHNLLPHDDFDAARHMAILNAVEDLRHKVAATLGKDEETKKTVRTEFVAGPLRTWAGDMELQLAGPFVAGNLISVADLKLFVLMNWFKKGVLDYVPTDCLADFPKLETLHAEVAAHPKIVEWYAKQF